MDLKNVFYGELKPSSERSNPDYRKAYRWLEKEVGFYPLFLAVGETDDDIRMTGYERQWARKVGEEIVGRRANGSNIFRNVLRKKGDYPNFALFSFDEVDGVFMDFMFWHIPLNSVINDDEVTPYERRLVFKPSWLKSKWLGKARRDAGFVQLVTPRLYLPAAKRVWVRNLQAKKQLTSIGFENVEVRRLLLEELE